MSRNPQPRVVFRTGSFFFVEILRRLFPFLRAFVRFRSDARGTDG